MEKGLKLHSPAGSDPVCYAWPLVITNTRDESVEIIDSIRWVCEDFPELTFAFQNIIMKEYDSNCYESMSQLCNKYNKAIDGILQLVSTAGSLSEYFFIELQSLTLMKFEFCIL